MHRLTSLGAILLCIAFGFVALSSPAVEPVAKQPKPAGKKPAKLPTDEAQTTAPKLPPREGKRERLELFNGKDLSGWIGHKDKYWNVQDGVIVGKNTTEIPVSTYLLTERKFSDFRLTFDFKLAQSEMHSGVAIWGRLAPEQGDEYTYAGHLVMFPSGHGFYDLYGRKGIHANGAIARRVGKQHDWNHIEVLAQGNRIRFVLNGKLISDWREPEPDRIKEAPIGLQLHSNKVPQEVQFKNIVVETFPADKLTTLAKVPDTDDDDDGKAIPLAVVPPCCAGLGDVKRFRVYFGTYTRDGQSKGIYRSELDVATGRLSPPVLAAETPSPSFLVMHPSRKFVYAVGEEGAGKNRSKVGQVVAFAVDEESGDLKQLNVQSAQGGAPCHITVDNGGKNVLIANYTGGSCAVLPIKADGRLEEISCLIKHSGEVFDPKRQGAPRAHSINLDAANKFAFCADLGLDKVLIYKYDSSAGTLTANDPAFAETAKRAGPRHFAFHPSGRYAYVINEIDCTITAFSYDAEAGKLTTLQTVSTLPLGVSVVPQFSTAEVQVHPSGRFVYGSNRTQNSIVTFAVDPSTGKLSLVGHKSEGIDVPRNFGIDPTGKWAVVANQAGNDVRAFAIDPQTGALAEEVSRIEVGSPVCVKFVPIPEKSN